MWMRKVDSNGLLHYECIAAYVYGLFIDYKSPEGIINLLQTRHKFKLKVTGPIRYHLGCKFDRDEHSALCFNPSKCIEKMADAYFLAFGSKHKTTCSLPLEPGDHLELDSTPIMDKDVIQ